MSRNAKTRFRMRPVLFAFVATLGMLAATHLLPMAAASEHAHQAFTLRGARVTPVLADEQFAGPVDVLLNRLPAGCSGEATDFSWTRANRALDRPLPQNLPGDDLEPVVQERQLLRAQVAGTPIGVDLDNGADAAWTVTVPSGRHYVITVVVVVVCPDGVFVYVATWYQRN